MHLMVCDAIKNKEKISYYAYEWLKLSSIVLGDDTYCTVIISRQHSFTLAYSTLCKSNGRKWL